jgi:hypothetical protein
MAIRWWWRPRGPPLGGLAVVVPIIESRAASPPEPIMPGWDQGFNPAARKMRQVVGQVAGQVAKRCRPRYEMPHMRQQR